MEEKSLQANKKKDEVPRGVLSNSNKKLPCYSRSTTGRSVDLLQIYSEDNSKNNYYKNKINPSNKRSYDEAFWTDERGDLFPPEAREFEDLLDDQLIRNWFKGSIGEPKTTETFNANTQQEAIEVTTTNNNTQPCHQQEAFNATTANNNTQPCHQQEAFKATTANNSSAVVAVNATTTANNSSAVVNATTANNSSGDWFNAGCQRSILQQLSQELQQKENVISEYDLLEF